MGLVLGSHANPTAIDDIVSVPDDAGRVLIMNPDHLASDDAGIDLLPGGAQNFTDAWVDLGPEIAMHGYSNATLFLTLDINDDSDLRIRFLAKHESGGTEEYPLPTETAGAGVIAVEDAYYEFTDDVDQLIPVPVSTSGSVPYVQAQIQRGVNGAGTAAQVDAAYYVRGTM